MTERGDTPTEPTEPTAPESPATGPLVTPPPATQPPATPSPAPQPPAPPPPATPLVAWEAPAPAYAPPPGETGVGGYAGGPPRFTVGALLSDSFARYGADPVRFFAISLATSALSVIGSFSSIGSNPFVPRSDDASGLLGLLSFVVGFIASSVILALAEGGPSAPLARVLRRGIERSGWLFLTTIIMILGFVVIAILAVIVLGLLALLSPELSVVLLVILLLPIVWLALRVGLALPANVADNLNSIEALQLSWRATKPSGVWARIFAASVLLGLLLMPASLGAGILFLPAMFGGQPALLVVSSLVAAFLTPLGALIAFSAYRRLVPPIQPSWVAPLMPADAPPLTPADAAPVMPADAAPAISADAPPAMSADAAPAMSADAAAMPVEASGVTPPVTEQALPEPRLPEPRLPEPRLPEPPLPGPPQAPAFRAPVFGAAARAVLGIVIALDVAGILAVPYVVAEMAAGRITLPTFPTSPGSPFPGFPGSQGFVVPGTVAFGTSADLDTCTVQGQNFFLPVSGPVVWIAALERRTSTADEVFLRVTLEGEEIESTLQEPGEYDCLGTEVPETGLVPGVYVYEVIVNGRIESAGSVFLQ